MGFMRLVYRFLGKITGNDDVLIATVVICIGIILYFIALVFL